MNQEVQQRLNGLTPDKTRFSISDVLNEAWELFGKVALYAVFATLLYFFLSTIVTMVLGMIFPVDQTEIQILLESDRLDLESLQEAFVDQFNQTNYKLTVIANFLLASLLYPIMFGVVYLAYKRDQKQVIAFGDIFYAYKNGLFLKSFTLSMLSIVFMYIGFSLCFVPGFVLSALMMLSVPFALFTNLDALQAIKASFRVTTKNFSGFIGMLFLMVLILIVGFLVCIVGLLAAYPLIYIIMYVLYKKIIGFEIIVNANFFETEIKNPYQ
ncbi:hypothetical protein [Weeksella sp. HMSC059D05]|uniref:hypothetical protein n=1 Tax=Weeksella sp. HMSC059D05 TaxID=1715139 RepID=UPI0008A3424B|nr:hypothetical protein [Weeksella sp. HMSC059D05]OFM81885.1 hypothetical protein HMPREF2660_05905 [Weeksella sp. HMSC059D05]